MAWLNTAPKPRPGSKRAKAGAAEDEPPPSRLEKMRARKSPPQLPPNPAPHIVDRLVEMGMTEAAGMGVVPLSWALIDAWCARNGIDLDPWQAKLLRRLSAEYINEGRRAEAETCPPPWGTHLTATQAQAEEAELRALLG